jgi:hypothetical protein
MPFKPEGPLPPRKDRAPIPDNWDDFLAETKRWLEHHWGGARCPYCNGATWEIGEVVSLVSAPEMWPLAARSKRGYFPAVTIHCAKCGHIALVNALYIFYVP